MTPQAILLHHAFVTPDGSGGEDDTCSRSSDLRSLHVRLCWVERSADEAEGCVPCALSLTGRACRPLRPLTGERGKAVLVDDRKQPLVCPRNHPCAPDTASALLFGFS
jgi:hypothetical protein